MDTILLSILTLGGMGIVFGLGLGFAEKKFKVEEDPRLGEIINVLPSVNCGACGFPGCGNFAQAILRGEAGPADCPVGGNETAMAIGAVLGVKVKEVEKKCAFIRCGGGESKSNFRYEYHGMADCNAAMQLTAGGAKACSFGCLGGGSCVIACGFGAIVMEDGIARVNSEKCTGCLKCVPACPKKLIVMVPVKSTVRVACNAQDEARAVRANCKVGCVNCKLCEKACDYDAINVYHLLADVEYKKCNNCGDCVEKCPTRCIVQG